MDYAISAAPKGNSRTFGPEYGSEAVRRLEAGFSIIYSENGTLTEEHPSGRRFAVCLGPDDSITNLRELPPKS